MRVKARIKGCKQGEWVEDFEVGMGRDVDRPPLTEEEAVSEVKAVVKRFNDSLHPGETPREFLGLVDFGKSQNEGPITTIERFFERAREFKALVAREAYNAAGNRWCQEMDEKVATAYDRLGNKGGITRFKKIITESPYRQKFQDIVESPMKSFPKEK